jgi:hypothetical protein
VAASQGKFCLVMIETAFIPLFCCMAGSAFSPKAAFVPILMFMAA